MALYKFTYLLTYFVPIVPWVPRCFSRSPCGVGAYTIISLDVVCLICLTTRLTLENFSDQVNVSSVHKRHKLRRAVDTLRYDSSELNTQRISSRHHCSNV